MPTCGPWCRTSWPARAVSHTWRPQGTVTLKLRAREGRAEQGNRQQGKASEQANTRTTTKYCTTYRTVVLQYTVQYSTSPDSTAKHRAINYSTVLYSTLQHTAIPYKSHEADTFIPCESKASVSPSRRAVSNHSENTSCLAIMGHARSKIAPETAHRRSPEFDGFRRIHVAVVHRSPLHP